MRKRREEEEGVLSGWLFQQSPWRRALRSSSQRALLGRWLLRQGARSWERRKGRRVGFALQRGKKGGGGGEGTTSKVVTWSMSIGSGSTSGIRDAIEGLDSTLAATCKWGRKIVYGGRHILFLSPLPPPPLSLSHAVLSVKTRVHRVRTSFKDCRCGFSRASDSKSLPCTVTAVESTSILSSFSRQANKKMRKKDASTFVN